MEIKVYTIPGCRYCDQVKELFARANVEYEAVMLDTTELKEQFTSEHPNVTGFPHVIIDGEVIGGLVARRKHSLSCFTPEEAECGIIRTASAWQYPVFKFSVPIFPPL